MIKELYYIVFISIFLISGIFIGWWTLILLLFYILYKYGGNL